MLLRGVQFVSTVFINNFHAFLFMLTFVSDNLLQYLICKRQTVSVCSLAFNRAVVDRNSHKSRLPGRKKCCAIFASICIKYALKRKIPLHFSSTFFFNPRSAACCTVCLNEFNGNV